MKSDKNIREGYKKTAVGVIPVEWEVKPFNKCFKHLRAYTVSRNQLNYERNESCIYNIHYGDIHSAFPNNILDVKTDIELIPVIVNPEIDTPELLQDGDLIMADASEDYEGIGKTIELANVEDRKIVSGTHTFPLRPITEFAPKYAGFIFSEFNIHKQIMKIATGISVYGISKGNIPKVQLPIPPLPEQQAIANCLTTWDSGIEKLTQLIAAKREQKKGLMQQLLTGKKRLEGFVGEWKEVKLGDKFEYKNGKSYEKEITDNGKYNLITLNSIDITGELKNTHHKVNINDNSLKKDDVIMILSDVAHGYFLGLSALIPDNSYVLNQRVGGLRLKSNDNVIFIRMLINFNQRYFKRMGQGSSQQNLSKGDILKFKFKLPSLEEQNAITTILTTADKEIALLEKKLEAMKEEKKGLMQVLLTGKKRLIDS